MNNQQKKIIKSLSKIFTMKETSVSHSLSSVALERVCFSCLLFREDIKQSFAFSWQLHALVASLLLLLLLLKWLWFILPKLFVFNR